MFHKPCLSVNSHDTVVLERMRVEHSNSAICMDQLMVDVTDIPEAKKGDEVTLIGKSGNACITLEELGEMSGRFNYEFACLITPRVPRVYYGYRETHKG